MKLRQWMANVWVALVAASGATVSAWRVSEQINLASTFQAILLGIFLFVSGFLIVRGWNLIETGQRHAR